MKRPPRTRKSTWLAALLRYYKDPSASVLGKLVVFLAMIYVVVPVDLIPDVPLVGWLDDLGVMGLAVAWLTRVVSRYRAPAALPEESTKLEPKLEPENETV